MAEAIVIKNFGKVEIASASNNLTEEKTMADESMAFVDYIRQQGGVDFLRGVVKAVLTRLMDCEVTGQIGASPSTTVLQMYSLIVVARKPPYENGEEPKY